MDTPYIEAHGTGTEAGDFVEASAIRQTLSSGRSMDDPLIVGSVKTNIGHAEAASGLASVIKAVYMLEAGLIPPNLNFEKAHPRIPFLDWRIKVSASWLERFFGLIQVRFLPRYFNGPQPNDKLQSPITDLEAAMPMLYWRTHHFLRHGMAGVEIEMVQQS